MKLKQVLEFVRAAPIMMSASQEVELIEHICALTDEELVGDFETLAEVLSRLYESQAGSAVFEVDDHNLPVFTAFATRLRQLANQISSRPRGESLESVASVFEVDPKEVNWQT
jgi:hypothetical protein